MAHEDEEAGKIRSIHIKILDDGTFLYSTMTQKMQDAEYSYQSVNNLISAIKDDLMSPHLRKTKFVKQDSLKTELSRNVKVKNYESKR